MHQIQKILQERIMVLDGAMGTMIQRHKLQEEDFRGDRFQDHPSHLKGNNDILSLTQPKIIKDIHRAYLEVGADIIETNTFTSTSISQADYQLEKFVLEVNRKSAEIAREAADEFTKKTPDQPRFVAGSIGPTNHSASISPDVSDPGFRSVSFDQLKESYKEQAKGLVEGGVDLFLIETIFDTLNAKAALFGLKELEEETNIQKPIMVSGTITDGSGRTLSGQTTKAFLISVSHLPILSIGLNCALGAKQLRSYIQVLAQESENWVSIHPNAGLPNEFGEYDESPKEMARDIEEFLKEGWINIVGGCCGTTPDHIAELVELAKKYQPRSIPGLIEVS